MLWEDGKVLQRHDKSLFDKKFDKQLVSCANLESNMWRYMQRKVKESNTFETALQNHQGGVLESISHNSSLKKFAGTARQTNKKKCFGRFRKKKKETIFIMHFPHAIPREKLKKKPMGEKLFTARKIPRYSLAG